MKDLNNKLKQVLASVLKMSESKFNIKIKPKDSLNLLSFKKISSYLKSQI